MSRSFLAEELTIGGPLRLPHASLIYEIHMPANNNQGAVRMHSRLPASMAFLASKDIAESPGLIAAIRMARSRTSKPVDIVATQNAASTIIRAVAPVDIPTKNERPGFPFPLKMIGTGLARSWLNNTSSCHSLTYVCLLEPTAPIIQRHTDRAVLSTASNRLLPYGQRRNLHRSTFNRGGFQ